MDGHAAVAAFGLGGAVVEAVLEDFETAPVPERLRAALRFLEVFVPPDADFGAEDIDKMRAAGLSDTAIRELMMASFCFQNLSRWADANDWPIPTPRQFYLGGWTMWTIGYTTVSLPPDISWRPQPPEAHQNAAP